MVYTWCTIPPSLFFGVRKCIGRQGVDKVGISDSDVAIGHVLQNYALTNVSASFQITNVSDKYTCQPPYLRRGV